MNATFTMMYQERRKKGPTTVKVELYSIQVDDEIRIICEETVEDDATDTTLRHHLTSMFTCGPNARAAAIRKAIAAVDALAEEWL